MVGNHTILETKLRSLNRGSGLGQGYNTTDARFGRLEGYGTAIINSRGTNVGSSAFFVNEVNIPVNSLNISFPTNDGILISVASTSANDTAGGTGLTLLLLIGLDVNFDIQLEPIAMNGLTKVTSTLLFSRINLIQSIGVGSLGFNEGDIYVSDTNEVFVSGLPTLKVFRTMAATFNFAGPGTFTIARGHTALAIHTKVSTDATEAKPIAARISAIIGGIHYILSDLVFNSGTGNFPDESFGTIGERTDLILSTKATQGTIDLCTLWLSLSVRNDEKAAEPN